MSGLRLFILWLRWAIFRGPSVVLIDIDGEHNARAALGIRNLRRSKRYGFGIRTVTLLPGEIADALLSVQTWFIKNGGEGDGWLCEYCYADYGNSMEDAKHLPDCIVSKCQIALAALRRVSQKESVPADVVRLVIAARAVAFGDHVDDASLRELDKASEAFAVAVPWEDEPEHVKQAALTPPASEPETPDDVARYECVCAKCGDHFYTPAKRAIICPKCKPGSALCSDCPPVGYPTDKTRCTPCPRRTELNAALDRSGPPLPYGAGADEYTDEDMAAVGRDLMKTLRQSADCLEGWAPCDSPAEIVVDLINERDELRAKLAEPPAPAVESGEIEQLIQRLRNSTPMFWSAQDLEREGIVISKERAEQIANLLDARSRTAGGVTDKMVSAATNAFLQRRTDNFHENVEDAIRAALAAQEGQ